MPGEYTADKTIPLSKDLIHCLLDKRRICHIQHSEKSSFH